LWKQNYYSIAYRVAFCSEHAYSSTVSFIPLKSLIAWKKEEASLRFEERKPNPNINARRKVVKKELELLYEQLTLYNPADDPDKAKLYQIWSIKSNKKRKRQLVEILFVDPSMVLQSTQLVTALQSVKKSKKNERKSK